MVIFSSAKINLGLFVKNKREDGYHNIETIFWNLKDYNDVIEILPTTKEEDEFVFYGKTIQGDLKENLLYKALQLIRRDFPNARIPLKIILYKNIPMGAGLGGGSSNAAHLLKGLNTYFDLNISTEKLESYALELGSDCPFFIQKKPCIAEGRGEIFTPIDIDLEDVSIQVITPEIHISTAIAFHNLQIEEHSFSMHELGKMSIYDWKEILKNDFEKNVFQMFPEIQEIKQQMYEAGAIFASLSGTGSTVYGIFPKNKKATIDSTVAFQEFYCK